MLHGFRQLILCALLLGSAYPVAADTVVSEHLTARLIAENAATQPGDTVTVALHQKMAPGWHTYWRNPGDSGQAPSLAWELPQGVVVGEPHWPAPHRLPVGPLVNFGYSDETALLYDVTVPAGWPAGQPLALAADAEILVCAEICIPVSGRVALNVATAAVTEKDPANAALFAETRAEQPLPAPWPVRANAANGRFSLQLDGPQGDFSAVTGAYVFADAWGVLDHPAAQRIGIGGDGLSVHASLGEAGAGKMFSGVVTLYQGDGPARSFRIDDAPVGTAVATAMSGGVGETKASAGVARLIVLALAGGLLLNLMPCVFPVLAMKALGLARQADAAASKRLIHGLAYCAGVVASFLALAGVLVALRASGDAVGWGFQLQEPLVVGVLAYVCAAVGLNLSGVFEIGGRLAGVGGAWVRGDGHASSFATGVLAAVVAAPCTAPFMATAIGGALLLPPLGALSIFAALGLGLALPYLAVSAVPGLARRLPKPGPWMVRFKQFLAFPMYATAAWLIWVLSLQAGADAAFLATLGLIALGLGVWVWAQPAASGAVLRGMRAALIVVALGGAAGLLGWASVQPGAEPDRRADSPIAERYTDARLAQYRDAGRTVFVNMTAAWCITCKVNERVALSGSGFEQLLARHDVAYLQGDWTNRDPEITRFLERFGRAGVPLYVVFPAGGGEPRVLPQILKPDAVGDVLASLASGRA